MLSVPFTAEQLGRAIERAVTYRRQVAREARPWYTDTALEEQIIGYASPVRNAEASSTADGWVTVGYVVDGVAGEPELRVQWHPKSDALRVERPGARCVEAVVSEPRGISYIVNHGYTVREDWRHEREGKPLCTGCVLDALRRAVHAPTFESRPQAPGERYRCWLCGNWTGTASE